ncbi:MAG TPA: hypothetical protein VM943_01205 [Pyrinomonadaceae bacterium]|nr:hypothetical protein [Pyrinomonadaceae bacterium]
MGEGDTHKMPDSRSFEERVFARFDALDAGFQDVYVRLQRFEAYAQDFDARLQKLETRAYDTKPIWEKALKEIVDTRRELSKRLDRIESVTLGNRANVSDLEERVEKLEFPKPAQ